jgi:hypothetical protein
MILSINLNLRYLIGESETSEVFSTNEEAPQLVIGNNDLKDSLSFESLNELGFKIYSDCRPRNLEIALLQKGLILTVAGVELIEEGAGFGVPIAKYLDHTFFSGTATICAFQDLNGVEVFKKSYHLDRISKKEIKGVLINDSIYTFFRKTFERVYLQHVGLRSLFDLAMKMRNTIGIQTKFTKVKSRGIVEVTYTFLPSGVKVHVDLSSLDMELCQEVLLLNEQGALHFRKYCDANGVLLYGGNVGAWERVSARQASFSDVESGVSFSLENVGGAIMYRGREKVKGRFSWAGLTYSLKPHVKSFDYVIGINNLKRKNV